MRFCERVNGVRIKYLELSIPSNESPMDMIKIICEIALNISIIECFKILSKSSALLLNIHYFISIQ